MRIINALSAVLLATATLVSQATLADWTVPGPTNADPQNIVIVVAENPRSNPERTCLAVTLANALADNPVRPHNVTIFATLDGTALGLESVVSSPRFKCTQSDGNEISLKDNLENFIGGNDNNLVICPICYEERFGDKEPEYGVRPGIEASPLAVIDVLSNADKVIDF
jgi:sulfur relay (sulfurtransferase) complex TusBCD TusD component (DsrE family)